MAQLFVSTLQYSILVITILLMFGLGAFSAQAMEGIQVGDMVEIVGLNAEVLSEGDVAGAQPVGAQGLVLELAGAGAVVTVSVDFVSGVDGWVSADAITEVVDADFNQANSSVANDTSTNSANGNQDPLEGKSIEELELIVIDLQQRVLALLALRAAQLASARESATDSADVIVASDADVTASAEKGMVQIYRDGQLANTLQNKTRKEARVRCRTLSRNVPTQGYRCVWNDEEVFSKGEVVVRVNGVNEIKESGRSRLNAFQQCRAVVETNQDQRVVCKWQGQDLLRTNEAGNDESIVDILTGIQQTRVRTSRLREAAEDETLVYKNGSLFARRSGLDQSGAVALCAELSENSPNQGFICTFDGRRVATHGHLRVNDRSGGNLSVIEMASFGFLQNNTTDEVWYKQGLSKNQAIAECHRVYATGKARIQCYWHNGTGPGTTRDFLSDGSSNRTSFNGGQIGLFIDRSPGGNGGFGVSGAQGPGNQSAADINAASGDFGGYGGGVDGSASGGSAADANAASGDFGGY